MYPNVSRAAGVIGVRASHSSSGRGPFSPRGRAVVLALVFSKSTAEKGADTAFYYNPDGKKVKCGRLVLLRDESAAYVGALTTLAVNKSSHAE